MRWNHPTDGMIPLTRFLPLAEETGLIVPLGEWVLRKACSEAAGWSTDVRVAVNLSPAQFKNRNLATAVALALSASGLRPDRLELEITEVVLVHDSEARRRCTFYEAWASRFRWTTSAPDTHLSVIFEVSRSTGSRSTPRSFTSSLPAVFDGDRAGRDRARKKPRHHHYSGRRGHARAARVAPLGRLR